MYQKWPDQSFPRRKFRFTPPSSYAYGHSNTSRGGGVQDRKGLWTKNSPFFWRKKLICWAPRGRWRGGACSTKYHHCTEPPPPAAPQKSLYFAKAKLASKFGNTPRALKHHVGGESLTKRRSKAVKRGRSAIVLCFSTALGACSVLCLFGGGNPPTAPGRGACCVHTHTHTHT